VGLLVLLSGLAVLPWAEAGEILIYTAPDGARLFTDRLETRPGYRPVNAAARRAGRQQSQRVKQIDDLIYRLAPHYNLEAELVRAIVAVESNYQVHARSPKNAQGLMQLIPATAKRFGVTDPFDPEQNLRGGMAYLQWLLSRFQGSVRHTVAAYNAGENAVNRYGGVPPYPETRRYIQKVRTRYSRELHPYTAGLTTPWQPGSKAVITLSGS